MTKRQERDTFFKLLFMMEFYSYDDTEEQLDAFIDSNGLEEYGKRLKDRYFAFIDERTHIDEIIAKASDGWRIDRMSRVDLNLIRLAVYEMDYEDLDVGVAINEAVELAKTYGGERSYAFINGVLAKIKG